MEKANRSGKSTYEFCSVPLCVHHDPLSDLLTLCKLSLKQFGHQQELQAICGPRIYGDLELIYVLSGECIINIDGTDYHGFAGDLLIIPKYSICSIAACGDGSFQNYWMHIDESDGIHAERLKHLLGGPLLHLGKDAQLLQYYHWLEIYYAQGGDGSYLAVRSLLHLIILRVIYLAGSGKGDTLRPQFEGRNSSQVQLLQKSIQLITSCHGAISVEDICRQLYVSPTYLRRVFRNLLQEPPLTFIRSVRIREAEILLLTTTETISSISAQLGFSSPYHFCNEFRKFHSVSPQKYRTLPYCTNETNTTNTVKKEDVL